MFMCDGDLLVLVAFASRSVITENSVQETPLSYAHTLLLQNSAYSYRVWMTLIKLLYAPLRGPKTTPIFTKLSKYAVGCYPWYCQSPRRTLLGFSVNKRAATIRPDTV